jgi:hypothetical protein
MKIFNFAILFILCLQLYFSKYYVHQAFLKCQYLIFKNINHIISQRSNDSNFISSELFPYNEALSDMIRIFKFHIYVADSMKLAILNNNSICMNAIFL